MSTVYTGRGGALRSLIGAAATLFIGIFRGGALAALLIAVVVPSATATVLLLGVEMLYIQGSAATEPYVERPSLVYSEALLDRARCVEVAVESAAVKSGGEVFEALVFLVGDFGRYAELSGLRIASSGGGRGSTAISVGWLLARGHGLEPGSPITICFGRHRCFSGYVTHVHRGDSYLGSAIIAAVPWQGAGVSGYLCRAGGNPAMESIVGSLGASTAAMMRLLALSTLLAYVPVQYLALGRALAMLGAEIGVLRSVGVPIRAIRIGFAAASAAACLLLTLYGVSIGALLTHLSAWLLRLLGVVIVEKPLPQPHVIASLAVLLTAAALAESLAVSRRIGGSPWGGS